MDEITGKSFAFVALVAFVRVFGQVWLSGRNQVPLPLPQLRSVPFEALDVFFLLRQDVSPLPASRSATKRRYSEIEVIVK